MNRDIKNIARDLRKNQTDSEKLLWDIVRNRKLFGQKFLRQYVLRVNYLNKERYFIADFYCANRHLVIELDGKIHEKRKAYDSLRTKLINTLGINVVRIKNEELIDIEMVKDKLKKYL